METSEYWKIRLFISTKEAGKTKGVVTVSCFSNSKKELVDLPGCKSSPSSF